MATSGRGAEQELKDVLEITHLKARYCRLLDRKDWEGFRAVFADQATVEIPGAGRFDDVDDFVAFVRARTAGATTVHQCTLPEITIIDEVSAAGIWAMMDLVQRGPTLPEDGMSGFRGYGHYHERYSRTPEGWRISNVLLERLRLDQWDPPD